MASSRDKSLDGERDNGPWYKQFWAWFVLAPLLVVMIIWIPFMTVIVKDADDVVVDNYYKEGRMYNMRLDQDRLASQLGLRGELFVDLAVGEVLVTLNGGADVVLPEQLTVNLDHPLEADNDLVVDLHQVYPGRYLGELPHRIENRWYVRLLPVLDDQSQVWRITGELDIARAARMSFGADE